MRLGICAGGPIHEIVLPSCDGWIGVDRGSIYLLEAGIEPIDIIGDFDSVSLDELEQIRKIMPTICKVNAEKDETDTELAISRAVSMDPKQIVITGVTGGRLDHYEAALRILMRFQLDYPKIEFTILNKQNELMVLEPGVHSLLKRGYDYISFFAVDGAVEGVTLEGVKYEVNCETIERHSSRFTSNEIVTPDASISFKRGICLVIRSID